MLYTANTIAATGLGTIWTNATTEGQVIVTILAIFSVFAWATMGFKARQMRQARRLNYYFNEEFSDDESTLAIFEREVNVSGCPLFTVYQAACEDVKHYHSDSKKSDRSITEREMAHVTRTMERTVAQESLKLESGLILLAIAVSGAPFLGLLGTVWGVMSVFSEITQTGSAELTVMAPGLSAAMMTTVAGLLVAIPSMFGYNYLVHNLRVLTVELDNFAQQLASEIEKEFQRDEGRRR